jgi:hypothetical protein
MPSPAVAYRPRTPERDVLRGLVADHFESFRARAAARADGGGLPSFVEREFRAYVTCGALAGGFARFRCRGCGAERLVAFSCKRRGLCPSCGGRRMVERAAHLIDRVLPAVPIRQWVLTLPPRVRYLLAWNHDLTRAVAGVYVRAVVGWLRNRARRPGRAGGRGGAVVIVQRFGAALNLNVHLHALVPDGIFVDAGARARFVRARPAAAGELATLLATIARRIQGLLVRRGVWDDAAEASDPWGEQQPVLAQLAAASVMGVAGLGPRAGVPVRRWGDAIDVPVGPEPGPWQARGEGFDLHAGVAVAARNRDRLEQLCRYALRPAVGQDRLQRMPDGSVVLELRRRWTDGTTHLVFDPVELLERLAALVPRPRINLVLYYGVFAARAAGRAAVVPVRQEVSGDAGAGSARGAGRPVNPAWAGWMQRSFGFDVLACPRCPGQLRLVALIHQPAVVRRILTHLGLPTDLPVVRPSRDPPVLEWAESP